MGKSVSQLETDVRWWEDEIRQLDGKLVDAKRTLEQRKHELTDAKRDEEREKERAKSSSSGNRH